VDLMAEAQEMALEELVVVLQMLDKEVTHWQIEL